LFFYFTIPTQQAKEKLKWLFNLGRAISTGFCRIAKIELTLPTTIFIAVSQQCFIFSLKARKETCFFFKSCIVPHSSLKFRKTRINYSLVN